MWSRDLYPLNLKQLNSAATVYVQGVFINWIYSHLKLLFPPYQLEGLFGFLKWLGLWPGSKMAISPIIYNNALSWVGILAIKLTRTCDDNLWPCFQHRRSVMARLFYRPHLLKEWFSRFSMPILVDTTILDISTEKLLYEPYTSYLSSWGPLSTTCLLGNDLHKWCTSCLYSWGQLSITYPLINYFHEL